MQQLGNGLYVAEHYEDALSVQEAELAMERRVGADENSILATQTNLANSYATMGRLEEACQMERDIYRGRLKLHGEEHGVTLEVATNYAASLISLKRFEEAKSLLRKTMPVAQRTLGDSNSSTLRTRWTYADALYADPRATLDDLRESVTTLEDLERIARRVLGGTHPITEGIDFELQNARAALRARDGGVSALRAAVEAMTPPGSA